MLGAEKLIQETGEIHPQISCNFAQNAVQRPDAEFLVCGDGEVVFGSFERRGKAHVASGLAGYLVAVGSKQRGEFLPVQVAREFQAGITSSFTR